MLENMGIKARQAASHLALSTDWQRADALHLMASALEKNMAVLLVQNAADLNQARNSGMSEALLDRLALSEARVLSMAEGLRAVAALPDPLHQVQFETKRPNGIKIRRVSVPLGVIGLIYEARPNVTSDAAALCLRAGNACILRGGKEAINSNTAIAMTLRQALLQSELPQDSVQLITQTTRDSAKALMNLTDYVDVLIPRGGKGLIDSVVKQSRVPVLKTGEGICHIYVDQSADLNMAVEILDNAKTQRPSVCNACECLLIHQDIAAETLPMIYERLSEKGVTFLCDERAHAVLPHTTLAQESDWGQEFLGLTLAVKIVSSLEEALSHIARYGTGHSEAILTNDTEAAHRFLSQVDAAAIYHNASTRFTDGGEFGFGAEIGISTQKLHARGPVGLKELTSYKYQILGEGQVRK